jgi:hypothetical protein
MRTKTLLLSAALGALSSASLMAQVYSLNAVGYINVSCLGGPAGAFTLIANQLNTTNNFISPLLDSQLGSNPSFAGCKLFKYSTSAGTYLQYNVTVASQANYQAGLTGTYAEPEVPVNSPDAATVTLNPGEGIWFFDKWPTNVTLTFVGTVLTGYVTNTPPNALTNVLAGAAGGNASGFQIVSSMVPVAGVIDTNLGVVPVKGDKAFVWDTNLGTYDIYNYTPSSTPGNWSVVTGPSSGNGSTAPYVSVGQAFWYFVGANDVGGTNAWVENFAVSQ